MSQLSYAGRAPFIYGNPPRGYDSPEQALQERDAQIEQLTKERNEAQALLYGAAPEGREVRQITALQARVKELERQLAAKRKDKHR